MPLGCHQMAVEKHFSRGVCHRVVTVGGMNTFKEGTGCWVVLLTTRTESSRVSGSEQGHLAKTLPCSASQFHWVKP